MCQNGDLSFGFPLNPPDTGTLKSDMPRNRRLLASVEKAEFQAMSGAKLEPLVPCFAGGGGPCFLEFLELNDKKKAKRHSQIELLLLYSSRAMVPLPKPILPSGVHRRIQPTSLYLFWPTHSGSEGHLPWIVEVLLPAYCEGANNQSDFFFGPRSFLPFFWRPSPSNDQHYLQMAGRLVSPSYPKSKHPRSFLR